MREPKAARENPLKTLEGLGQSIWIDFIQRRMILSGELQRLIDEDGVSGVTSNPTIFEKAIDQSQDYDNAIHLLGLEGKNATEMYETLAIDDIQHVADILRPLYETSDGADGFVSLEVSPHLAHDTPGTIAEARRLWNHVARPNAMIKVPATDEGIPAIGHLIGEGINVNITLLFGLARYRQVTEAYLAGLEEAVTKHLPLRKISSVASFFLSRIDVLVDPLLSKHPGTAKSDEHAALALQGRTALSCARLAYRMYRDVFGGERFRRFAARGARTQRLLWASTSTKNPEYPDVKYVEPLIGPGTINTLPLETLRAYRDHGRPRATLSENVPEAREVLEQLTRFGYDLETISRRLEEEGTRRFDESFDLLLSTIARKSDRQSEVHPAAATVKPARMHNSG
ncbi:MAG TPA: transaldolase [Bacteroidota bacterium]|nr:transaldolase [Bacteroidota bacterium]